MIHLGLHHTMKGTTSVLRCVPFFSSHWFRCVPILLPRSSCRRPTITVYSTHQLLCGPHRPLCMPLAHIATDVYPTPRMSDSTLWVSHVLSLSGTFQFHSVPYNYLTTSFTFQLPTKKLGFGAANILLI
jgi:hypothetical protein